MSRPHPLFRLLDEEREAIRLAAFDRVDALAPKKERLLQALPDADLTPSDLSRLAQSVSRNQRLLQAAIDGFSGVQDRLAALRRAAEGFDTYARDGGRSRVGGKPPSIQRKA